MRIELTEEQTHELQFAVRDREDLLKKVRKKVDDLGLSTAEVDRHLQLLRGGDCAVGLKHMLDDQTDAFDPRQHDAFDETTQTIDEALDGVEEEGEKVRQREIRSALVDLLPDCQADALDDEALLLEIADYWKGVEFEFEDEDMPAAKGVHLHTTLDGREVWCFVRGGDAPNDAAFFYDLHSREDFDPEVATATLEGAELAVLTRELYAGGATDPDSTQSVADEEGDTAPLSDQQQDDPDAPVWAKKMKPDVYLRRFPNSADAELARKVLEYRATKAEADEEETPDAGEQPEEGEAADEQPDPIESAA